MAGKFSAMAATAEMHKCNISFLDVEGYAQKAIDLLNSTGTQWVALLHDGFLVYQGITGKDFTAVLDALNDVNAQASTIVAAIKTTFGI